LAVVALGTVIGGDVVVKEGTIEGEVFKSTGCTATGAKAAAFGMGTIASGNYSFAAGYGSAGKGAIGDYSVATGYYTTASGLYSTAMGSWTTASGSYSTAMGLWAIASNYCSTAIGGWTTASGTRSTSMGGWTTASGSHSTAMGYNTRAGSADYTFALGKNFTNNVQDSFAVGFGGVDFRVGSGVVTVGNVATLYGDLYVGNKVDAHIYASHSAFYDKDAYGRALNYAEDCSKTVKINAQGQEEYNHEADPEFLKTYVTVKDYDKYTEEKVWNEELQEYEPVRIYQTHQELRTNLGMQVAWLRQCVYELKQENQTLKTELAAIKAKLGM